MYNYCRAHLSEVGLGAGEEESYSCLRAVFSHGNDDLDSVRINSMEAICKLFSFYMTFSVVIQGSVPLFSPLPYSLLIYVMNNHPTALPTPLFLFLSLSVALPPAVEEYSLRKAIHRVSQGAHIIPCFLRIFSFRVNICLSWHWNFKTLMSTLVEFSYFYFIVMSFHHSKI